MVLLASGRALRGMLEVGHGSQHVEIEAYQWTQRGCKSPQRVLLPSLLKSRNKLRAKYRELRAECKRWRDQGAAVERSRRSWHQRTVGRFIIRWCIVLSSRCVPCLDPQSAPLNRSSKPVF